MECFSSPGVSLMCTCVCVTGKALKLLQAVHVVGIEWRHSERGCHWTRISWLRNRGYGTSNQCNWLILYQNLTFVAIDGSLWVTNSAACSNNWGFCLHIFLNALLHIYLSRVLAHLDWVLRLPLLAKQKWGMNVKQICEWINSPHEPCQPQPIPRPQSLQG